MVVGSAFLQIIRTATTGQGPPGAADTAEMAAEGGLITLEDLRSYTIEERYVRKSNHKCNTPHQHAAPTGPAP